MYIFLAFSKGMYGLALQAPARGNQMTKAPPECKGEISLLLEFVATIGVVLREAMQICGSYLVWLSLLLPIDSEKTLYASKVVTGCYELLVFPAVTFENKPSPMHLKNRLIGESSG
jgi:hypothetical protein